MRFRFSFFALIAAAIALLTTAQADPLEFGVGIVNPSPNNNDLFGAAISISGGQALIGAPLDATTGTGSGRAYIYDSSGALLRTFENPTPASNDQFGGAVSLSGNQALIGARNDGLGGASSGVAYLFDTTTGLITRTFANPGPTPNLSDNFGHAVAISGNQALISAIGDDRGATNAGAAYTIRLRERSCRRSSIRLRVAATISDTTWRCPAIARSFRRSTTIQPP
jgi:FG-GAP repeat